MSLRDVESIYCSEANGDLIIRGLYREFEITELGQHASRESVELAPEDCPLTTWAHAYHRYVGLFNACLECPNASVDRIEPHGSQNADIVE